MGKIKSTTSLVGALLFLGIALYFLANYRLNISGLALLIMAYFLTAAFLGVRAQVTTIFRMLMMSIVLLYVISLYL